MRTRFLIPLLLLPVTLQAETQNEGKVLFESYCNLCHQLPEPDMLNAKQWQRVMETMQTRMQQADISPLNEDEFAAILGYLEQQIDD